MRRPSFTAASGDEVADLVDEHDRVIGQAVRPDIRARKLLHRGVAVLCRNASGEIYVHRRTASKDVFPGMYDMFIGGMVAAGERYETAARRELAEELGITGPVPRFVLRHRVDDGDNPAWIAAFEVAWDGPLRVQHDEIAWGAFMAQRELLRYLDLWPFTPERTQHVRPLPGCHPFGPIAGRRLSTACA